MKRAHVDDASCWCEPFLYYKSAVTEREVWVHRASRTIHSNGLHLRLMDNPDPIVLSAAVRMADDDYDDEPPPCSLKLHLD